MQFFYAPVHLTSSLKFESADYMLTVLIPVRNEEGVIRSTVESVLQQSPFFQELLIVENFSTDSTWKEVTALSALSLKVRVQRHDVSLTYGPDILRSAIQKVRTPHVFLLGSDDSLSPNYLKNLASQLSHHPGAIRIISPFAHISESTGECFAETKSEKLFEFILQGSQHSLAREVLRTSFQDWLFYGHWSTEVLRRIGNAKFADPSLENANWWWTVASAFLAQESGLPLLFDERNTYRFNRRERYVEERRTHRQRFDPPTSFWENLKRTAVCRIGTLWNIWMLSRLTPLDFGTWTVFLFSWRGQWDSRVKGPGPLTLPQVIFGCLSFARK